MFSQTAVHVINALRVLAELEDEVHLGAAAVADRIGAPRNYLGKLLQALHEQGLVVARKGPGGGFRLACPAERISIYQAIEPWDRCSGWERCCLGLPECSDRAPCPLHHSWGPLRDRFLDLLRRTSIADLEGEGPPRRRPARRSR